MQPPHFAALIDTPSNALLMLSLRLPVIAFLVKTTADVRPSWGVNYPNYLRAFPLADADPLIYPQWMWNGRERLFELLPKALLTDRVRHTSALAVRKAYALFEMIQAVSTARNLLWSGVLMQDAVNLTKRAQAQAYADAGYPEADPLRYPYVLQYAEVANLPMKAAAHEILFKAQLDDELLAKTEGVRLKYLDLLKSAQIDTIDAIMEGFRGAIQ